MKHRRFSYCKLSRIFEIIMSSMLAISLRTVITYAYVIAINNIGLPDTFVTNAIGVAIGIVCSKYIIKLIKKSWSTGDDMLWTIKNLYDATKELICRTVEGH